MPVITLKELLSNINILQNPRRVLEVIPELRNNVEFAKECVRRN